MTVRRQVLLLAVFVAGECLLFHRAPLIPVWTVLTTLWGLVRLSRLNTASVRRWIPRRH